MKRFILYLIFILTVHNLSAQSIYGLKKFLGQKDSLLIYEFHFDGNIDTIVQDKSILPGQGNFGLAYGNDLFYIIYEENQIYAYNPINQEHQFITKIVEPLNNELCGLTYNPYENALYASGKELVRIDLDYNSYEILGTFNDTINWMCDLAFYDDQLYGTGGVNTNILDTLFTLMIVNIEQPHLSTPVKTLSDCVFGNLTTYQEDCNNVLLLSQSLSSPRKIFDISSLDSCDILPPTSIGIIDLASPTEGMIFNCELFIDLDEDDSTNEIPYDFRDTFDCRWDSYLFEESADIEIALFNEGADSLVVSWQTDELSVTHDAQELGIITNTSHNKKVFYKENESMDAPQLIALIKSMQLTLIDEIPLASQLALTFTVYSDGQLSPPATAFILLDGDYPSVSLPSDTTICAGDIFTVGQESKPGEQFLWNTLETQPYINISTAGIYQLQITNGCGESTDSLRIETLDTPDLDAIADYTICIDDPVEIEVDVGMNEILWNTGSNLPSILIDQAGLYTYEVENLCGIFMDSFIVEIDPRYDDWMVDSLVICDEESIFIGLENIDGISWNTGQEDNIISVNDTGLYSFQHENACGLWEKEYVIAPCIRSSTEVYVPNSFTPNDDGINDQFVIFSNENMQIMLFEIYDRWGNKVYSEKNTAIHSIQGWNGQFHGQSVQSGIYSYMLQLEDEPLRTGNILVIR